MSAELDLVANVSQLQQGIETVIDKLISLEQAQKRTTGGLTEGQREIQKALQSTLTPAEKLQQQLDNLKKSTKDAEKETEDYKKALKSIEKQLEDSTKVVVDYNEVLNKVGGSTGNAITGAKSYIGELKGLVGTFGPAIVATAGLTTGVVAVGGALIANAQNFADTADSLDKLAASTGLTTAEFSKYRLFAQKSDLDNDKMAQTFGKLNEKILDNSDVFKSLGISLKDSSGEIKGTEQVFFDVADAISNLKSPTEQSAIATKLFGDDMAKKLLPALKEGSFAIKQLKEQNDALGLTLSDASVKAATDYKDAVEGLETAWTGITQYLGGQTIPLLRDMAVWLQKAFAPESLKVDQKAELVKEQISDLYKELDSTRNKIQGRGGFLTTAFGASKEELGKEYDRIQSEIKKKQGELSGLLSKLPGPESTSPKTGTLTKPEPTKKTSNTAEKAAADEKRRVEDLTRAIEALEKARQADELAALEGFEKIKEAFDQEKEQIETQRDTALKLAKTEGERAAINEAADAAIVAAREKGQKELQKLRDKEESEAKKTAEKRIEEEAKASDQIKQIIENALSGKIEGEQEYYDQIAEIRNQDLISAEEYENALAALDTARLNKQLKDQKKASKQQLEIMEELANSFGNVVDTIYDYQLQKVDKTNDEIADKEDELSDIKQKIEDGTATTAERIRAKDLENEIAALEEKNNLQQEAAMKTFKIKQALEISQAIINTAAAVIGFLADPGGTIGAGMSIAAGITGAASIATIATQQPPKFHTGGEVPAILQAGEYVIKQSSVKKLGTDTMDYINQNGKLPSSSGKEGQQIVVLSTYDRRIIDRSIYDSMKIGGIAKQQIKSISSNTNGHSNRR